MAQPTRGAAPEVFLVLELFRSRLAELLDGLAPLSEGTAPRLLDANIYYRPDTDVALLSLRLDRHGDGAAAEWLRSFARAAKLPLLDPARLGETDRHRFYEAYLDAYPIRATAPLGARAAALALARRLDLPEPERTVSTDRAESASDLVWPAQPELTGAPSSPFPSPPPALNRRLARAGSDSEQSQPPSRPLGKTKIRDRLRTIPGRAQTAVTHLPQPQPPPKQDGDAPTPAIVARYLRGDDWALARLRSVSLRGAQLAAGALPRVGDAVPIALGFGDTGAVLRGRVVDVTTDDEARDRGASGFQVAFNDQEEGAIRQLTALLRKARAAGVSLAPPPPRAAVRFPIRWPIQLTCGRRRTVASALDISAGGFFLATRSEVGAHGLEFQLPLDWGESPVLGHARVARVVTKAMALGRGLSPGYGVEIVELDTPERHRFDAFLTRVSRRAQRRVWVAASPDRCAELTAALAAVGYAVTSYSEATALASLPDTSPQPPDAVVLDADVDSLGGASSADLARRFEAHGVPCITTTYDAGTRMRARVDRALGIG